MNNILIWIGIIILGCVGIKMNEILLIFDAGVIAAYWASYAIIKRIM